MRFKKIIIISIITVFTLNISVVGAISIGDLQLQINDLLKQLFLLQEQLTGVTEEVEKEEPVAWCHDFIVNLKYGMAGSDVVALQTALEKEGFIILGSEENFGTYTSSAVIRFQEKYSGEVLGPWGLKYGTGYVGSTTTKKLNELYGCPKKCSSESEFCGGIAGIQCCSGLECALEGGYPDAGGTCKKESIEKNCHISSLWVWDYCSSKCKCDAGQGDCDTDAECSTGYCALDVGEEYDQDSGMDVCEDKEKVLVCDDSDDGKNYLIRGTALSGVNKYTDYCIDGSNLKEYFCSSGKALKDDYNCPYGCQNGACIPEAPQYIIVNAPNGEEQWFFGETYEITWSTKEVEEVDIYLVDYSCSSKSQMIIARDISTGSYLWSMPGDLFESKAAAYCPVYTYNLINHYGWAAGDDFKIKIVEKKSDGTLGLQDESDIFFNIIEEEDAICTDLDDGKDYYIAGTCIDEDGTSHVDICLCDIGTYQYLCGINSSYENKLREYSCDPFLAGEIICKSSTYDCPNGCEDGACIIEGKSVSVTYPNGGEELKIGGEYDITWEAEGFDNVDIILDGVQSDTSIIYNLINTGNYSWVVPENVAEDQYKISVREACPGQTMVCQNLSYYDDSNIDSSDDYFNIVEVEVLSCTDSDNGKDYYIKGGVQDSYDTEEFYDYCTLDSKEVSSCTDSGRNCGIIERYCDSSYKRQEYYVAGNDFDKDCPFGCKDGACIEMDCLDTDEGEYYYTKGITYSGINTFTDSCLSSSGKHVYGGEKLIEYFCVDPETNEVNNTVIECSNGCQNGACIINCVTEEEIRREIQDCEGDACPSFSSDQNDRTCCNLYFLGSKEYPCVYNEQCYYQPNNPITLPSGEAVLCINNTWIDSDQSAVYCEESYYWVAGAESGSFGEYEEGTEVECCGDDSGEYYTAAGFKTACCDSLTDTLDEEGNCMVDPNLVCEDSDDGVTEYVYGYTTNEDGTSYDVCRGFEILEEWSCDFGERVRQLITCANGCVDGVCKKSSNTSSTGIVCEDSDNGKDYDTFGTVTHGTGTSEHSDSCLNITTLREQYCSSGYYTEELYICEKGCENGACKIELTCTDSDGGKVYTKKGTTKNELMSATDSCYKDGVASVGFCYGSGCAVKEFYCGSDKQVYFNLSYNVCPYGCENGICRTELPPITVTSPDGGETWTVGSIYNIGWLVNGVSSVDIYLHFYDSTGTGIEESRILVNSLSGSGGSYSWTISSAIYPGSRYKIAVRDSSDLDETYDMSDDYFVIASKTAYNNIENQLASIGEAINRLMEAFGGLMD